MSTHQSSVACSFTDSNLRLFDYRIIKFASLVSQIAEFALLATFILAEFVAGPSTTQVNDLMVLALQSFVQLEPPSREIYTITLPGSTLVTQDIVCVLPMVHVSPPSGLLK